MTGIWKREKKKLEYHPHIIRNLIDVHNHYDGKIIIGLKRGGSLNREMETIKETNY